MMEDERARTLTLSLTAYDGEDRVIGGPIEIEARRSEPAAPWEMDRWELPLRTIAVTYDIALVFTDAADGADMFWGVVDLPGIGAEFDGGSISLGPVKCPTADLLEG
jgi:hypothetical protein